MCPQGQWKTNWKRNRSRRTSSASNWRKGRKERRPSLVRRRRARRFYCSACAVALIVTGICLHALHELPLPGVTVVTKALWMAQVAFMLLRCTKRRALSCCFTLIWRQDSCKNPCPQLQLIHRLSHDIPTSLVSFSSFCLAFSMLTFFYYYFVLRLLPPMSYMNRLHR